MPSPRACIIFKIPASGESRDFVTVNNEQGIAEGITHVTLLPIGGRQCS